VDETESADKKFQKELTSGISALVLLSVLHLATEPMYGYQIARLIESQKETLPMLKQGALYPVLRSLEASGLLESRVEPSVSGPPRRYYSITDSGRKTLERWKELWGRMETFVNDIMKGESDDKKR
jgi:PadR family transcriptional regulator PadR